MRYLALALCMASPAMAQQQCLPLPEALASLDGTYHEQPRVQALDGNGSLLIITASEAGSWSALIVTPDGKACMVASGQSFQVLEPVAPGVMN